MHQFRTTNQVFASVGSNSIRYMKSFEAKHAPPGPTYSERQRRMQGEVFTRVPAGEALSGASKYGLTHEAENKQTLLIIDPQNDFHPGGSLAISSAHQDAQRIAEMINTSGDVIDEIIVTLDTHLPMHISHPLFWVNQRGEHPKAFTTISLEDVIHRVWFPVFDHLYEYAHQYVRKLNDHDRFQLCIWPEHCLIGTPGHCVVPVINDALQAWAHKTKKSIRYIMKGNNGLTEHYSAVKADVLVADDPNTTVNNDLISTLNEAQRIVVCGQALSHCVNFTVRDILQFLPQSPRSLRRLHLCVDGSSSVPGYEKVAEKFLSDIQLQGCQVVTCADAFHNKRF